MFYLSCSVEHELIIFLRGKNSMGNEKTNIETEKTKIYLEIYRFYEWGFRNPGRIQAREDQYEKCASRSA